MEIYVQLNIGRNIDGKAMSPDHWHQFVTAASNVLINSTGSGVTERHYGTGEWDGVTAESAHISILTDSLNMTLLTAGVEQLKEDYEQESIALVIGSHLL